MNLPLTALRKVNFEWTAHIEDVWSDHSYETEGLQPQAREMLGEYLEDLVDSTAPASPLGVPLLGPAGSGKTHLLSFLRRSAVEQGSYFILADMTDVSDFWETLSLGYLRSLQHHLGDGRRQIDHWLERMIKSYGQAVKKASDIPKQRPPGLINRTEELIKKVREKHRAEVQEHVDVLRALILFACDHADINDLGYKWLQGMVIDDDELGIFGFRHRSQTPSRIVRGLSWLLSLTGPSTLALDQLDAIVAEHELARGEPEDAESTDQQRRSLAIIQGIAGGLLALRDVTRRTLCVVSSLETTWDILDRQAPISMADRFTSNLLLKPGSGPDVLREMVTKRLQLAYSAQGYTAPYASYPYTDAFFEKYQDNTPRELLKACEAHRRACRSARTVSETGVATTPPTPPGPGFKETIARQVADLSKDAPLDAILADDSEQLQDRLLEFACDALVIENPVPDDVFPKVEKDFMNTGSYDPLHARVRLVLTSQGERERHHSFRFLEKDHYRAFQARLKAALTASGIDEELHFRGLTIVRRRPIPSGKVTEALVASLENKGGRIAAPTDEDLRTLWALQQIMASSNEPEGFEEWLREDKPVSNMNAFKPAAEALFARLTQTSATQAPSPAADSAMAGPSTTEPDASQATQTVARGPATEQGQAADTKAAASAAVIVSNSPRDTLPIGHRLSAGELSDEVGITLERLPYHTCVFAGSGSGKTVFLKRVIEEATLLGIPSIVLDGANDLSRLGMAWPELPDALSEADQAKAKRYQEASEVIVWTPGAALGNPMRLNPLPDFSVVASSATERDAELDAAIEVAVSSIASMIVKSTSATATRQTAILKGTLRHFAQRGGTIRDLVRLLSEPPEDVIQPYEKGEKLARDLSELLYAEIENDPLVGGSGSPLDPAMLFNAQQPSKTRVSVLNLVGLPSYDQKRRFVDQLSGTLFSWIKKNPAPPGGLLGLLVIDEAKDFVPSGKAVPGKENMIRLAAQARKYGLGLLFATQEPKSIDHAIVSNCSTLLAGKMSSPAAIDALQQLLADKGTRATDVGSLPRGTFYFGSGPDKPRKIRTSLCLSYHPSTPPSETEILSTAKASRKVLGDGDD